MTPGKNIWFFTEEVSYRPQDKGKVRQWIGGIIKKEGFKPGRINIVFCSDAYLLDKNIKYLNNNDLTDIITFDMSERKDVVEGDIYISVDRARENAKEFKVHLQNEIRRLIIHGLMHLCGYNDQSPAEKVQMTRKEDYYLSLPAN
jgi:rRNA maturation RNase YbeY